MAFPLGNIRAGLGTTAIVGVGNYHVNGFALQVEFITATAIAFTQLFIIIEGSISGTQILSIVYDYNAAAAATTFFNTPYVFPGLNCVMPRGDAIQARLINVANVAAATVGVNMWGSKLT